MEYFNTIGHAMDPAVIVCSAEFMGVTTKSYSLREKDDIYHTLKVIFIKNTATSLKHGLPVATLTVNNN